MLKLIKDNKNKIIKYAVAIFIGSILIIQIPYWVGNFKLLILTDFTAGDILGFLGDFMSAIGTVVLGWVAIMQADKANDISNRVLSLEEKRYTEDHVPAVTVEFVKLREGEYNIPLNLNFVGRTYILTHSNTEKAFIEIELINTGKCAIYGCELNKVLLDDQLFDNKIEKISGSFLNRQFNLIDNNMKFFLCLEEKYVEDFAKGVIKKLKIEFDCKNGFGEKYKLEINIEVVVYNIGWWGNSDTFKDILPVHLDIQVKRL